MLCFIIFEVFLGWGFRNILLCLENEGKGLNCNRVNNVLGYGMLKI